MDYLQTCAKAFERLLDIKQEGTVKKFSSRSLMETSPWMI